MTSCVNEYEYLRVYQYGVRTCSLDGTSIKRAPTSDASDSYIDEEAGGDLEVNDDGAAEQDEEVAGQEDVGAATDTKGKLDKRDSQTSTLEP